jgi:hypothetical protein
MLARGMRARTGILARGTHGRVAESGVVLAALIGHVDEATGVRLRAVVEAEAAASFREGLAVLAARGEPVAHETLDQYLEEIARAARAITRPADESGYAMGRADDPRLTARAVVDGSQTAVDAAIDAVVALLSEDRQCEQLRIPWIGCAVRLGRGAPDRVPELLTALLRIGTGGNAPSGFDAEFSDHPLSGIRWQTTVGETLRAPPWPRRGHCGGPLHTASARAADRPSRPARRTPIQTRDTAPS